MEKTAIVTGVASGMGKYIAQKLLEEGVHVFGLDIEQADFKGIDFFQCDVSNEEQVKSVINEISEKSNKLDYLINVAGILCYKERSVVETLSTEEWKKVLEVNLDSVFYMVKNCLPLLKNSSNGSIVNFSSDQVASVKRKSAPYAVSKAAIEMFTKIVALEQLENHIRANVVAFASVDTNFIKKYVADDEKMKKMIEKADSEMPYGIINVEDAWNVVHYLIQESNKMTGQVLLIDSGTILKK